MSEWDGWSIYTADGSLSAHFEHTIAVTENGPWVLTRGGGRRVRMGLSGCEERGGVVTYMFGSTVIL